MTLEDIAVAGVETAGPDTTIEVLAVTMADSDVGSVVVVEDGRPVGIVTDRDLTVEVLAAGRDPDAVTAADVMTTHPRSMHRDAGVLEATTVLCQEGVRRLPVVGDDGRVVGIVTLDDLVRLLSAELGNLAGVVESESPT